jgi:AcrR family transcriptional regulator
MGVAGGNTRAMTRNVLDGTRLGRPRATDSVETRRRILETARAMFAAGGYEATTNRDIAPLAGVTPAALYHYFSSKLDLYLAVLDDTSDLVHQWLLESVLGHDNFESAFSAILDEALRLASEHPAIPAFLGTVRVDARRQPEIEGALRTRQAEFADLFAELINLGVSTGEIPVERRSELTVFVLTALSGLTDLLGGQTAAQQLAVSSYKSAVAGRLISRR